MNWLFLIGNALKSNGYVVKIHDLACLAVVESLNAIRLDAFLSGCVPQALKFEEPGCHLPSHASPQPTFALDPA